MWPQPAFLIESQGQLFFADVYFQKAQTGRFKVNYLFAVFLMFNLKKHKQAASRLTICLLFFSCLILKKAQTGRFK